MALRAQLLLGCHLPRGNARDPAPLCQSASCCCPWKAADGGLGPWVPAIQVVPLDEAPLGFSLAKSQLLWALGGVGQRAEELTLSKLAVILSNKT